VKVAEITGLGKTSIGFLLVSSLTTLPELSVSVIAVLGQENVSIAIGNVIGSNIVNICLILGISFLFASLKNSGKNMLPHSIEKEDMQSLYFGVFVASVIPLILIYVGEASRFIGLILIILFIYNSINLSKGGTREKKKEKITSREKQRLNRFLSLTFLGAMGVVASAYFIVDSASYIAIAIGVPQVVIGATIVAFGTSLPELVISIDATKKGHLDLAFGNAIGACFINITCILGVALIGSILTVNMTAFSNLVMFSIIANLFLWYFLTNKKAGWREGILLLFLYSMFLIMIFTGYRT